MEDHPGATQKCDMRQGSTLGIPDEFGGQGIFCVCTIQIPDREPVVAWKPVPPRGDADAWVVACTKTLGRALKKAGYPDDLNDLKGLMHWRQREAEIAAILGGNAVALKEGPKPLEITAGGKDADDDDTPDVDEGERPAVQADEPEADDVITDAEIVEEAPVASEPEANTDSAETTGERDEANWERLVGEVRSLTQDDKDALKEFLAENNLPSHPDDWTDDTVFAIDTWMNT